MAAALICYRMISFVIPVALGLVTAAALIPSRRQRN
jgi:uncharacterized membrane protein YbhN (UPF0104 family)